MSGAITYFYCERGARYIELSNQDRPARLADGSICLLKDAPVSDYIEVFVSDVWMRGWIASPPKKYEYTISVWSFDDGKELLRALEKCVATLRDRDGSSVIRVVVAPISSNTGEP